MTSERASLILLAFSVIVGAGLGLIYDLFRVFRIALYGKRPAVKSMRLRLPPDFSGTAAALRMRQTQGFPSPAFFLTLICDLTFSLFSALCVTVLLFQFGDGRVRAFALLGAFVGFTVYYFTIGRAVIFFSDAIIRGIKFALHTLVRFTVLPIVGLIARVLRVLLRHIRHKHRERITKRYISQSLRKY